MQLIDCKCTYEKSWSCYPQRLPSISSAGPPDHRVIVAYSGQCRAPDSEGLTTKINWQLWVVACCRGLNVHVFIIYYSIGEMSLSHFVTTFAFVHFLLKLFQVSQYDINEDILPLWRC